MNTEGISLREDDLFRYENSLTNSGKTVTKLSRNRNEIKKPGRPRKYQTNAEKLRMFRKQQKQREKSQTPLLPDAKYRVIYADPPWKYSSDGLRKYGHAAFHYPCMTIEALCQLNVKAIADDQAV